VKYGYLQSKNSERTANMGFIRGSTGKECACRVVAYRMCGTCLAVHNNNVDFTYKPVAGKLAVVHDIINISVVI